MFLVGSGLSVFLFGLVLRAARWLLEQSVHPEVCRKIVHVAMGLASLSFPYFVSTATEAINFTALFIAILVVLRILSGHGWLIGRIFSDSRPDSLGEIYFACGVGLLLVLARDDVFAYNGSILLLTFSDVVAGAIGRWRGRIFCWGNQKTLEGSIAFAISALVCLGALKSVAVVTVSLPFVLIVCLLCALTEAVSVDGSDNLTIPAACVLLCTLGDTISPAALYCWSSWCPFVLRVVL